MAVTAPSAMDLLVAETRVLREELQALVLRSARDRRIWERDLSELWRHERLTDGQRQALRRPRHHGRASPESSARVW